MSYSIEPIALAPLSLYIHWPFCLSKCPYCDFNSYASQNRGGDPAWEQAYITELSRWREFTGPRTIRTIFFGGGTPSLMEPQTVGRFLNEIAQLWSLDSHAEISLEANPTSSESQKFQAFAQAGINRLSLGVQSLRQEHLTFLGREHDVLQARQAVDHAQKAVARVSLDVIYGLPQQTLDTWAEDLEEVLRWGTTHLSAYSLMIEPGTVFEKQVQQAQWSPKPSDQGRDHDDVTDALFTRAGWHRYEISNFAQNPDDHCRHNLAYWRYQDYLGIGPGAHGRFCTEETLWAFENHKAPHVWQSHVEKAGWGVLNQIPLSLQDRATEMLLMGLRLSEGIPDQRWLEVTGFPRSHWIDSDKIRPLIHEGLLAEEQASLVLKQPRVLDAVLRYLM